MSREHQGKQLTNETLSVKYTPLGAWTGGTVTALTLASGSGHGHIILAATAAGVFRSADLGHSWQRAGKGLADPAIVTVASAGSDAGADSPVWAATETGRLYHSQDAGNTWSEVESWAGYGFASLIVPSPVYDQDHTLFITTPNGIMRTTDAGQSWESSTFGLLDLEVLCLACTPDYAARGLLWAGTAGGGIYRSRNAARAWRESGAGLPDAAVQCVAISPRFAQDARLWVGLENRGIYVSTDGGQNWEAVESLDSRVSVNAIHIRTAPADNGTDHLQLFAATDQGIYLSTDSGKTWRAAAAGAYLVFDFAELADGSCLAATYLDGIIKSTDYGEHWFPANHGLAAHVPPLTAQIAPSMFIALDRDGAVALSADNARTWTEQELPVDNAGVSALAVGDAGGATYIDIAGALVRYTQSSGDFTVIASPLDTDTEGHHVDAVPVLAVQSRRAPSVDTIAIAAQTGPLYLSADSGQTWQSIPPPAQAESLFNLTMSPAADATPLLTAVTGWQDPRGFYQFNVWEWQQSAPEWRILANLASDIPSMLVAIAGDKYPPVRFLATQHRFVKLHANGPDAELSVHQHFFEPNVRITALHVSGAYASDETLYVATDQGLCISRDGGVGWRHYPVSPAHLPLVSLIQERHETLLGVTLGGSLARISLALPD